MYISVSTSCRVQNWQEFITKCNMLKRIRCVLKIDLIKDYLLVQVILLEIDSLVSLLLKEIDSPIFFTKNYMNCFVSS